MCSNMSRLPEKVSRCCSNAPTSCSRLLRNVFVFAASVLRVTEREPGRAPPSQPTCIRLGIERIDIRDKDDDRR